MPDVILKIVVFPIQYDFFDIIRVLGEFIQSREVQDAISQPVPFIGVDQLIFERRPFAIILV